ncbi:uncharacterized protein LOC116337626 isoform X2 [Contarinia nasturtii]|uniref:uncharacterized protein LOC116337626 isoform X2 n=1 Tax=Contarinia nasturtii TaxID=265458 RepID=UPI0012D3D56B|nr:uncharacterized protein LOC116337626 isoform X2 [Contarinia nasturtii]
MHLFRMWLFIIVLNTIHENVLSAILDIDENLVLKICNMKFCDATKLNCDLEYCIEQMKHRTKFGDCPKYPNNTRMNCFDDCDGQDYRCSAAQKCCWINNCNRSCIMAENLNRVSTFTLLPIPTNISVISMEHEARRKAKITWLMRIAHSRREEQIDYVVEARAHIGYTFSKHKMGQWFAINTENFHIESMHSHNSKISCLITLQIGRFYEFRVLAVNGNGTRGCSDTTVFQLNEKPKHVSPPTNLAIDSIPKLTVNNSVYTRLKWQEPSSEYPIEKYELSYSLYINEGNGSLVMEKLRLPITHTFYEFYDLLSNSMYYIQLGSISSFAIVYNRV